MSPSLSTRLQVLAGPAYLLVWAVYYFFLTVYETVFVDRSLRELGRINRLRARAFSRFWLAVAPPPDAPVTPVDDQDDPFPGLQSYLFAASGTVLDIGPGSGTFVPYFNASAIRGIYGAEPALDMHSALKASANVAGLSGKYHILPCGGERDSLLPVLKRVGLLKESGGNVKEEGIFDAIICLRVLCSVPNLESSLSTLYSLLRPGGRFIICEHVINDWRSPKGSILGRAFQVLYTFLGWPFFIGDCHMDRDTVTLLKQIGDANGGWDSIELNKGMEWSVLPFVTGILVKSRTSKG